MAAKLFRQKRLRQLIDVWRSIATDLRVADFYGLSRQKRTRQRYPEGSFVEVIRFDGAT